MLPDSLQHAVLSMFNSDDFHRPFTLDARNIVGMILAFAVSALAPAAGVGGGAFFVPLFNIIVGFGLKAAGTLSQAAIAGGSIASVIVLFRKRHPQHPTQCVIDFDTALVTGPPLLLGVELGISVSTILPSWTIALGLVLLLSYMCRRTITKATTMYRKEYTAKQSTPSSTTPAQHQPTTTPPPPIAYPWLKILMLCVLWVGFLCLKVLQSATVRCSGAYVGTMAGQVVLCVGCAVVFAEYVRRQHERGPGGHEGGPGGHADAETPLLQGNSGQSRGNTTSSTSELHFTRTTVLHSAVGTCVAGMVAGLLGLGGGMLFAPLLLEFGVSAEATTATSNVLVWLGSSSATMAWWAEDKLNLEYATAYALLCIAGATLGLSIIGKLLQATGHPSLLVFLLACIMGGGALVTALFGGAAFVHNVRAGHIEGLHPFCGGK